jgi:hypothetical protein
MSNPAFKFDHVHIISKDPEASANWYVEMLARRSLRIRWRVVPHRSLLISAG